MAWIMITIGIMVISFIANVMLTQECDHDWDEKETGVVKCNKCKKTTSARSLERFFSN